MELWIAEKPSMAADIARSLGTSQQKKGGYIEVDGGRIVVTWCIGHIFELRDPDYYISAAVPVNKKGNKIWRSQDLPIIPSKWGRRCTKTDQYKIIRGLLKEASVIVNAGDSEREGQLLVDEVLIESGISPDDAKVKRVWLQSLKEDDIRQSASRLRPNREYANLRAAAYVRSQADWLVGMNGTRAYTIRAGELMSVGRVQTPTLAMVVRRDLEIEKFVPKDFFVPVVTMEDGAVLNWKRRKTQEKGIDSEGRIIDRALADAIVARIRARCGWVVTNSDERETKEAPPLPHSLSSLSSYLSQKANMSLASTLAACQRLYETHKLTSYPRSENRYLPESMHADSGAVLKSLVGPYRREVEGANSELCSAAFDDKRIDAHHAIIPTGKVPASRLDPDEQAAYDAICRFYMAQFYPAARYRQLALEVLFDDEDTFVASEKSLLSPGWKMVFGGDSPSSSESHEISEPMAEVGVSQGGAL